MSATPKPRALSREIMSFENDDEIIGLNRLFQADRHSASFNQELAFAHYGTRSPTPDLGGVLPDQRILRSLVSRRKRQHVPSGAVGHPHRRLRFISVRARDMAAEAQRPDKADCSPTMAARAGFDCRGADLSCARTDVVDAWR